MRIIAGLVALVLVGVPAFASSPATAGDAVMSCADVGAEPVKLTFPAAGVRQRVCFTAGAGQDFGFLLSVGDTDDVGGYRLEVRAAGAAVPVTTEIVDRTMIGHFVTPEAGAHTVEVARIADGPGAVTFQLLASRTAALTRNGPAAELRIDRPGMRGIAEFDAAAGQRLSVVTWIRGIDFDNAVTFEIHGPDGGLLREGPLYYAADDQYDKGVDVTATVSGRYTLAIDPSHLDTVSATVNLVGGVAGSLTSGGPATTVTIGRPGENAYLTFPAEAGQHLNIAAALGSLTNDAGVGLVVTAPDGTAVVVSWIPESIGDNKHGSVGFITPVTGTYTFTLDPHALDTGTATVILKPAG
ncbi:hypothetical protein Q0Z83_048880 [Actinoplanes sichuanensis]|uniref:Uncharacterized protein n=1 Tax=Actinoplanes sichuanensis TaxID=512349 RepID=A0ABW4AQT4_9ACTN|nr:hypothetical protein [Actinoplanes sichuanensis]BEL06697.1 hypothetical protein Q0Z83_048880 [Actinoplanes sichuanensis]